MVRKPDMCDGSGRDADAAPIQVNGDFFARPPRGATQISAPGSCVCGGVHATMGA